MRNNNKGFTLIELLAVMVILVSESLVSVSAVTNSLTRREVRECVEQQELAVGAAKIYFSLNNTSVVSVGELKKYFKDEGKEEIKLDGLPDSDRITISSNKYLYNDKDVGSSCN